MESVLEKLISESGAEEGINQFKARFSNLYLNNLGDCWYGKYTYKSVGNCIHWIYTYSFLSIAENIQVGNGIVTLYGKRLATFIWSEDLQMPIFEFEKEYEYFATNQSVYLEGIKNIDITSESIKHINNIYKSFNAEWKLLTNSVTPADKA